MSRIKMNFTWRDRWRRRYHKIRNFCRHNSAMILVEDSKPTNHDWLYPYTSTAGDLGTLIVSLIWTPAFCYIGFDVLFLFMPELWHVSIATFFWIFIIVLRVSIYIYRCYKKKKWMETLDHYPILMEDIVIPTEFFTADG